MPSLNAFDFLVAEMDSKPLFESFNSLSVRVTFLNDLRLAPEVLLDHTMDEHPLAVYFFITRNIFVRSSQEHDNQSDLCLKRLRTASSIPTKRSVKGSAYVSVVRQAGQKRESDHVTITFI